MRIKDYGSPELSKDFFDKNPVKDLSAARISYSKLLHPKIEALATKTVKQFVTRGRKEAKKIRRETNPENLLGIMRQYPDPLNHRLLRERILSFSEYTIPKIIEELKDSQDDVFVELAISIIYQSKIDYSPQLLRVLNSIKDPYTLSLVCLLLGLIGSKESIQFVWNCYHFFQKHKYSGEDYEQGPLLGLYEFKVRFGMS